MVITQVPYGIPGVEPRSASCKANRALCCSMAPSSPCYFWVSYVFGFCSLFGSHTLDLPLEITPGDLQQVYGMPEIKPWSAPCNTRPLSSGNLPLFGLGLGGHTGSAQGSFLVLDSGTALGSALYVR